MIHRDRDPLLERIPVDLIHLAVMRGLDPRIHHLRKIYAKRMDPRVKPAGDGSGWASADSNRPGTAVVWSGGRAVRSPGDHKGRPYCGNARLLFNSAPDKSRFDP